MNVFILGGDARYIEVIQLLAEHGMMVYVTGYDSLPQSKPNIIASDMEKAPMEKIDAILLPVQGTEQDGKVETMETRQVIYLTEKWLRKTPNHCVIYTGVANEYLETLAAKTKRQLVCLFHRDDLAIYNSIPTAEATLKIAIDETDTTIHGAKVAVIGFGRVGQTVARLFSQVGANVTVAARKSAHFARLTELGMTPISFDELEAFAGEMDLFINTVPALVITENIINKMKKDAVIIDLASKPGGTDFHIAEKLGIKAIHALGLPGKTAPKTAGQIIGKVLLHLLREQQAESR